MYYICCLGEGAGNSLKFGFLRKIHGKSKSNRLVLKVSSSRPHHLQLVQVFSIHLYKDGFWIYVQTFTRNLPYFSHPEWTSCSHIQNILAHKGSMSHLLGEEKTSCMNNKNATKQEIYLHLATSSNIKTRRGFSSAGRHLLNSFLQLWRTLTGVTTSAVRNPNWACLITV